jgi:tetratricopeptide (TPR) repeat protein
MTKPVQTQSATESAALTEEELREGRKAVFFVTGVVFALFVAFVYIYGTYGGPMVDRLSDRIGENVSARAKNLADAGMYEEAIPLFREALTKRFEDEPQQRIWTMQRLSKVLLETKRYDDAIVLMQEAMRLDPKDGHNYADLYQALRGAGRNDEALTLTKERVEFTRTNGDTDGQRIAWYDQGTLLRDTGQLEPALVAFKTSFDTAPTTYSAWQAANALVKLNRPQEVSPYLEFILTKGDGTLITEARTLQEKIASTSGK